MSLRNRAIEFVKRIWPLWMLTLLCIRPKRFLYEFIFPLVDYWRFRQSLRPYRNFLRSCQSFEASLDQPGLLIIAGHWMNTQWNQLWSVLGSAYKKERYRVFVLTSRNQPIQNLYFSLLGIAPLYLENLKSSAIKIPKEILAKFEALNSFQDFKDFTLDGVPFGKMAISTYSRLRATGVMDIDDPVAKQEVRMWLVYLYQMLVVSDVLYRHHNIKMLFFTEVFMEEYGALYYVALKRGLNVVRFAGTVRDNAIVVQHLNQESDRTHFSSISIKSWSRILKYPDSPTMERELQQNFLDRYGDRWALSKRNQANTRIMPIAEAKALLGVPDGRKIVVIFSHILYDTLFFNGEDLFQNYADWLVQTVKAACSNPSVQWFIKIHPSNLWRGELEHFHGGKYEEVRLIEQYVGALPDHVRLIYPDTPISPYTWFQIADYGITVRGTSGIELGALGKTVITAGSGRYEHIGFSLNSNSISDYLALLARIPYVPPPTHEQTRRAMRFAFATFCMKPFTLDFFRPVTRTGKSRIFSSDDLVYLGNFNNEMAMLPVSMARFMEWSFDENSIDFLNAWPSSH